MNKRSILILAAGIALLFLSVLFPPWVVFKQGPASVTELPYGFGFLFTTPQPQSANVSIRVDFTTLFLEWLVLVVGVLLALWLERRRRVRKKGPSAKGSSS